MRQFLLGLSLSIAFILGCVTAQHVPGLAAVPSASAYAGQQWEYTCEKSPTLLINDKFTSFLNERGGAGWELLPVTLGDSLCFKRSK